MLPPDKIPIVEKFCSLQGEGVNIGVQYLFVRVGGCPLRCRHCDSEYTWTPKTEEITPVFEVNEWIEGTARHYGIKWVSITGGEPMVYPDQLRQMMVFCRSNGLYTHIETSGRYYDRKLHELSDLWSPDVKTPCTKETDDEWRKWIGRMRQRDQVKCLIETDEDMNYAFMVNQMLDGRCEMILQPFNTMVNTDNQQKRVEHLLEETRFLDALLRARMQKERWKRTRITPQLHVLIHGNQRGK